MILLDEHLASSEFNAKTVHCLVDADQQAFTFFSVEHPLVWFYSFYHFCLFARKLSLATCARFLF